MIKNLKFLELIYPKQKKIFFLILVMVIFASLLETLGVASIIPLLSFMVSGKKILEKFSFFKNNIDVENFFFILFKRGNYYFSTYNNYFNFCIKKSLSCFF